MRCRRAARDKSDGGRPGTFWLAAVDDRALNPASCLECFPLLERSHMQECCATDQIVHRMRLVLLDV